jgi:hypothetical protein
MQASVQSTAESAVPIRFCGIRSQRAFPWAIDWKCVRIKCVRLQAKPTTLTAMSGHGESALSHGVARPFDAEAPPTRGGFHSHCRLANA